MQPVDKASWLATLEEQVERHLQEARQHFQNLDEGLLCRPSPRGGWRIAQCLAHLNAYGCYYLPYLQEGLEKRAAATPGDSYVGSWLGTYLIGLIDPQQSRAKFKAIKRHQPIEVDKPHSVVAAFIDQQEHLLGLLKGA